jgi:tRNA U34 2-thiouridine synthase MnmA/TrmU
MSGGVDSSVAAWLLREQGHDVVGVFMRHGQEQRAGSCGAAVSAAMAGGTPASIALSGGTPAPQRTCGKQGCCTAADAADARRVAEMLGIPFYAVNFEQEFGRIVDYFVAEYTKGRTPNPCIVCNSWLKFGRLFDYADGIGAEYVATGHYARLVQLHRGADIVQPNSSEDIPARSGVDIPACSGVDIPACSGADIPVCRRDFDPRGTEEVVGEALANGEGVWRQPPPSPGVVAAPPNTACEQAVAHPTENAEIALCRGLDESKDQSYVLFGIQRHLLPRLMFPVGEYRKEEIRRIAERLGLRVAAKRDSQEICFVPDQDHARFIRQHRGELDTSGEIVLTDGSVVGRHDGFERFTVGQRKGLGIALGEPRYVVRIEPESRRVVLGTQEELARDELYAAEANWLAEERGQGSGGRVQEGQASAFEISKSPNLQISQSFRAQVKIRYRSRPAAATVEILPGDRFHVRFDEPCQAIAPGQAAVCYDGDRVLGGGWIE